MIDDVCNGGVVLEELFLGQEREGGDEHEHAADEQGEDTDDEALGNVLGGFLHSSAPMPPASNARKNHTA